MNAPPPTPQAVQVQARSSWMHQLVKEQIQPLYPPLQQLIDALRALWSDH